MEKGREEVAAGIRETVMKITVLYSKPTKRYKTGRFAEAEDDTKDSALFIVTSLRRLGHTVCTHAIDAHSIHTINKIKADLIFNYIEWTGCDLPIALRAMQILHATGIHYTGATPENYRDTTDKILLKKLLDMNKIRTATWQVFYTGCEKVRQDFEYPLFLKVATEHSGVGLDGESKIDKPADFYKRIRKKIHAFKQPVIVEEYLPGEEFEVGMIDTDGGLEVFPPASNEYAPDSPIPFLTYNGRWAKHSEKYVRYRVAVRTLEPVLKRKITAVCRKTFLRLGFRDYARFDLRLDRNGDPVIIEANSNPGIDNTDENGLSAGFKAQGYTFDDFIGLIVDSAHRRMR